VTLIQRHFSTSIQVSNPTKIQRLFNVDGQLKFNVDVPAGINNYFYYYDIALHSNIFHGREFITTLLAKRYEKGDMVF
jgi:hypothetical protein